MKKLIIIITLISGCAVNPTMTYYSNPTGAMIIDNGVQKGVTPITITYTLPPNSNCGLTNEVTARWVSGITELGKFNVCSGQKYTYTFNRPEGGDYQTDYNFALKMQQMQLNAAQIDAANAAANAERSRQLLELSQKLLTPPPSNNVHCVSTPTGGGNYSTNCY